MPLPHPPFDFGETVPPDPRAVAPPGLEAGQFADQPDPYFLPLEQAGPGFGRRALEALGGLRVSMGPGTSRGEAVGGTALGLLAMLGNSLARERARREAAGVKEAEATNRAMEEASRRGERARLRQMAAAETRATRVRSEARAARAEVRAKESHERAMSKTPSGPARGGFAFRMHPEAERAVKAAEADMRAQERAVREAEAAYGRGSASREVALLEQARDAYEATLKRAIAASVLAIKDPENRREALQQARFIYPDMVSEADLKEGPPMLVARPPLSGPVAKPSKASWPPKTPEDLAARIQLAKSVQDWQRIVAFIERQQKPEQWSEHPDVVQAVSDYQKRKSAGGIVP